MFFRFKLPFSLVLLSLAASMSRAQRYIYDAGSPAYGVNIPVENGFINVTNGNLHMEFHLANHPQRGDLQLDEKLVYDSHFWEIGHYSNYYWWPDSVPRTSQLAMGWRFVTGAETGSLTNDSYQSGISGTCDGGSGTYTGYNMTYKWQDPSGTQHAFYDAYGYTLYSCRTKLGGAPAPVKQDRIAYSSDGGYMLYLSGTDQGTPTSAKITDAYGNQLYPIRSDRYGNYWSFDGSGNLIDDRNQTPLTTTVSGNTIYYDVLQPGGGRARYTVTTSQHSVSTAFGQQGVNEYSNSLPAVDKIQLPDGSSYSFAYDSQFGEITQVTLPTGGVIKYGWNKFFDSYQNVNRWLYSRQVGSDPPTTFKPAVVTQCAKNGTGCQEKMTVHRPNGDDTVYNLTLNNGAWNTNTQRYSGSATNGGTLLSTTDTTYDFSHPCGTECTGAQYITASSVTTTLAGINLKLTDVYSYSDPTLGLVGSKKHYPFYSGSLPSNTSIETDYVYGSKIPGDVTEVKTVDGVGNLLTSDKYRYDSTPSFNYSITQNDSSKSLNSYLQSVSHWVNTAGSNIYEITDLKRDNAGAVHSMSTPYLSGTSPAGSRTLNYDPTDALLVGTAEPAVPSGVSLTTGITPDSYTGVPNDSTDYNAKTYYKNYDGFGRVGEVDNPDTGVTTYSYTPTQMTVTTKIPNSPDVVTIDQTDAFGRPSRVAVANGQGTNPWYQQDTCYDVNGNVQSTGQPYAGTGFIMAVNCSGTSYTYDALGRPLSVGNADGTVQYSYYGRATKVVDVNGKTTISQVDESGRLAAVCEVSSQSLNGVAPQNCGLDFAGTGFLTTYFYERSVNRVTVTQGAQTRVFQTDSLGRTIYTSEPERGVTQYSYSYNNTGLQVQRIRARANQTDANTTTTTTTQYDALGRIVSIVYNDNLTPNKTFTYDAACCGWTPSVANVKGRLAVAKAQVGTSASTLSGSLFSYDTMGRVTGMWACAPATCGTSSQASRPISYTYDFAGNVTSESDVQAGTVNYGRSAAGEITSAVNTTFTLSGGAGSANLMSNVVNSPNGPISYSFGNGLSQFNSYDSLGRLQGGWVCAGSPSWGCSSPSVPQRNGFYVTWSGSRAISSSENLVGQGMNYQYDDFDRLTGVKNSSGQTTYSYVYDRYGNRLQQNALQGGSTYVASYNAANNRIVSSSAGTYAYDAVGNMTYDAASGHRFTYDAEGNVLQSDPGQSNSYSYTYDAFNNRVHTQNSGGFSEAVYDAAGHLTSSFASPGESHLYADGLQIAYRSGDGQTYFVHQNWLGSDRVHTDLNGNTGATYASLPFGDGGSSTTSENYAGWDFWHFGTLDVDWWSNTYHAQYRQYGEQEGRWRSPDPYDGSYSSNPQSLNRYAYVMNNPLSFNDPSGKYLAGDGAAAGLPCGPVCVGVIAGIGTLVDIYEFFFKKPSFRGSTKPRARTGPDADKDPWSETIGGVHLGYGIGGNPIATLGGVLGFPTQAGCEFGSCKDGLGTDSFQQGAAAATAPLSWCAEHPTICTIGGDAAAILERIPVVLASAMLLNMRGDNAPSSAKCEQIKQAAIQSCSAKFIGRNDPESPAKTRACVRQILNDAGCFNY